ncbi:MAG: hypothetical protein QOF40_279 [Actinomycetota bacterium]|nr:hypothetical protein [Actinomycetota bacterium]
MSQLAILVSADSHHVALRGEVDIATIGQLDAALAGLSGDVEIDCTALEFIGSSGFHSFDQGYEAADARGAAFVVSGMNRFQQRVATLLGVPYVVSTENEPA